MSNGSWPGPPVGGLASKPPRAVERIERLLFRAPGGASRPTAVVEHVHRASADRPFDRKPHERRRILETAGLRQEHGLANQAQYPTKQIEYEHEPIRAEVMRCAHS